MAYAQQHTTKKTTHKKALQSYEAAQQALRQRDTDAALTHLEKALKKDPAFVDAILMRADMLLQRRDYEGAKTGFARALTLAPDYALLAHLLLAEAAWGMQDYATVVEHATLYLEKGQPSEKRKAGAERLLQNARFAKDAVSRPVPFEPKRLDETVNTERPEYLPSLTADGQILVYTTRTSPRNEDIYYSTKTDTGWAVGQPLTVLNSIYNDSSPSIAADGQSMVFARNDERNNFDLYYAQRSEGRWEEPERLPAPISTDAWESQPCLSADGQELYFVSNRGGGKGKLDLWISAQQADGSWGKPTNMGANINTPYNEQAPFLHPDGQTLYFMSKGHPGMGAYDLYLSRRQDDGSWATPTNLGYPINTPNNEGALIVDLTGQTAYFDTDQEDPTGRIREMGNADLYTFVLPEPVRPLPATYVRVRVLDAGTLRPLPADLVFTRLNQNKKHVSIRANNDGVGLVVLPLGEDYGLRVDRPGYLFHSENFALKEMASRQDPFELEIRLNKVPAPGEVLSGEPIVLKNVFFDSGSAELLPASVGELQSLAELLETYPQIKILISGHTDNVGQIEDNLQLSTDRAKAVYDYLLEAGIAASRLSYQGFGEGRPIADNETPEGRQLNRRTTFEVVE